MTSPLVGVKPLAALDRTLPNIPLVNLLRRDRKQDHGGSGAELIGAVDQSHEQAVKTISLFVSSPGDVQPERDAVSRVVNRINDEQRGLLNIRDIRWENAYYGAHDTFQSQIIETEVCDLVVCVFWRRLGSELPADFPKRMKNGKPYPSGTVYELITAVEARSAKTTPDVWVYKKDQAIADAIQDAGEMARRAKQWEALEDFWKDFFVNAQGQFTAAYKRFETVDQFEATFEKNLRDWLTDKRLLQVRPSWSLGEKGSPFRGLEAFDVEHERIMFGRERIAARAVEAVQRGLLSKASYLLLIGESGAGKSSLARAAVLPRILRLTGEGAGRSDVWRLARLIVNATESPLVVLAKALFNKEALPELAQSDYPTPSALAAAMEQAGPSAIAPITRALGRVVDGFEAQQKFDRPATARVVLLIDQLESLFATSVEDQAKFARLIGELVATGLFAVVATLRADRYEAYCRIGAFLALKEAGTTLDVPMPGPAEIADIVRSPAKAAGLSYGVDAETGEGLDETLIKATAGRDALPLLQFALEKLYEAMEARLTASGTGLAGAKPEELILRPQDYAALGGLEGAIGLVADTVYRELDAEARATLPQLVRALVRSGDKGSISESALEKDVVKSEPMARLVRALLARRILVAGVNGLGEGKTETTVRFAHEAVIRGWRAVRERIAADENFYRIRDEVVAAERRWRSSGKPVDRLIASGLPLAEAESLVRDFREELPEYLFAYVKASSAREEARRDRELAEARQREEDARNLAEEQRKVADAQRQVAGRTRAGLVAALLLALAACAFGIVAWTEKQTADQKTQEAAARGAEARNNQTAALAALSNATVDVSPSRAAKLALAAWPRSLADQTPKLEVTMTALGAAVPQLREREIFRGHDGAVWSAAFSPDGTRIVTASVDKTARLWDAATGKQIAVLRGHDDWVRAAAFSSDGSRIVTASNDKTARLWDAGTGKQIAVLRGHDDWVSSAAFSPDGARIVTSSFDKTGRLWDTATGQEIAVLRGHDNAVLRAVFSPDGTRVATASLDKTGRLWDAATGALIAILSGHEDGVWSAAFSPDGTRVVTASNDKTARLWDAATGAEIAVLRGHDGEVYSAAYSPDGTRVVTASLDKTAGLWNAATGKEIAVLRGHDGLISSAAFSSDGTRIVTASRDQSARVWDAATGNEIAVLRGHNGQVLSAAFSPDGRDVITASQDETARLWDAATVREIAVLRGHSEAIWRATFSPDGTRVVTASEDKTARLWDAATARPIAMLRGHDAAVTSAAFSRDGTVVLTASDDKTTRLWDVSTGAPRLILRGHEGQVFSAAFSPDGTHIVTASEDKTARLWDAATGMQIAVLTGHDGRVFSAAFSPDGIHIVTASEDKTARLWDAATGTQIVVFRGHDGRVFSAAFSPDATRIATAAHDKTARIWDAATGKQIMVLRGHDGTVWSAAFSPDGTRVVTASEDRTARLWDASTGAEIAVLRGHDDQIMRAGLPDAVYSAAFSADGTRVVTASQDAAARLWDVATIPKGNIFEVACAWLPDHDLTGIAREYGLTNVKPICEGDPPLPDFSPR